MIFTGGSVNIDVSVAEDLSEKSAAYRNALYLVQRSIHGFCIDDTRFANHTLVRECKLGVEKCDGTYYRLDRGNEQKPAKYNSHYPRKH